MPKRVVLIDSAKDDIRAARDWYRGKVDGLHHDFLQEVHAGLNKVGSVPEHYSVIYKNIRQMPLHRFPYVISYILREDDVVVVAVLYGGRNPSVWKRRRINDK